jgi:hypothetical protein
MKVEVVSHKKRNVTLKKVSLEIEEVEKHSAAIRTARCLTTLVFAMQPTQVQTSCHLS